MRDAREHVRALELEAREESRLAKVKADAAAGIGKSAKGLGSKYSYTHTCSRKGERVGVG